MALSESGNSSPPLLPTRRVERHCQWSRVELMLWVFVGLVFCLLNGLPVNCSFASDQLEQLYCGALNCYELLEIERSATDSEAKKAFRRLSLVWHPDRNGDPQAASKFSKIAKAHEVVTNKEVREAYDYYLDHPDDMLALLYGIRAVYPSRTNPYAVIILVLAFVSLGQFLQSRYSYSRMLNNVRKIRAFQCAVDTQIQDEFGTKFKNMSADEQRTAREKAETKVLMERVEVDGTIARVLRWPDLCIVQAVILPYTIWLYVFWNLKWIWRFNVMREPYEKEEKEYLSRKKLGLSEKQWKRLPEDERTRTLAREIWIGKNYKEFIVDKEEEERTKRINSNKYIQWKRWKKKGRDTSYNYNDD